MEPVTLTTERLVLRPFVPEDEAAVFGACQDPDIQRWTSVPSPYTRQDAARFIREVAPEGWRTDTHYSFGVFTRDNGAGGELVGCTGLVGNTEHRRALGIAELGYWTAKAQRRRGFTTEAGLAVARWAFTDLGVGRLEWMAEVGNQSSRAVAHALGFTMEGVQRSRLLHNGTRRDAWTAALLPSDLGLPSAQPYLPAQDHWTQGG